jgi:hypothetical protein
MSDSCQPPVTHEQFVRWGQARVSAQTGILSEEIVTTSANYTAAASIAGWLGAEGTLRFSDAANSLVELFDSMAPLSVPQYGLWKDVGYSGSWDSVTWKAVKGIWEGPDGTFARSLALETDSHLFTASNKLVAYDIKRILGFLRDPRNLSHLRKAEGSMVWALRESIAEKLEARMQRIFLKLGRAGLGFAAEAIIFALTTAVEQTIAIIEETQLPGRIASNVVNARSMEVDPLALTLMPGNRNLTRNLFANAVVPSPSAADQCGDQCPGPTPVSAASPTDPKFLVRRAGDATPIQTPTLKLGKIADDQWAATTVRVAGGWFVERWYDSDFGLDLQALELQYTNWDMQSETAWLIRNEDGSYLFRVVSPEKVAGFDLETCQADGTCWTSSTIAYLNADGMPMEATVEGSEAPTGVPSTSPAAPQVDQAVTFSAGGLAPGEARGTITYRWRFQEGGCGGPCLNFVNEQPEPLYGAPVAGAEVTYTWQEAGTYRVELTATDVDGRQAVTTMDVTVGGGSP